MTKALRYRDKARAARRRRPGLGTGGAPPFIIIVHTTLV
jgi:hypothetical protein